jgi:A/G-specific adenine glycosylase
VDTVIPYYERWLRRFPTVADLAAADEADVLDAWQGMGYYRRARQLHRAAKIVAQRPDGGVPTEPQALRELPGVGAYTAGAIAAIAFDLPEPAVDGNTARVVARYLGLSVDPRSSGGRRELEARTREMMRSADAPGELCQALMELGALVCTPTAPRCGACPLVEGCVARAEGTPTAYPAHTRRRATRDVEAAAFCLKAGDGDWVVARRRSEGLLGGLWEFPMALDAPADDPAPALAGLGLRAEALLAKGRVTHVFTHMRLRATLVTGRLAGPLPGVDDGYTAWRIVAPANVSELPRSKLAMKLMALAADP